MINTVSEFIAKIGGPHKAADYFGVTVPAVYNWQERGFPLWAHNTVRTLAQKRALAVAPKLLSTSKPIRRPSRKRRALSAAE